jgi:predicted GNAT family acetyltransferase
MKGSAIPQAEIRMSNLSENPVRNNEGARRFEIDVEGLQAFITYERKAREIVFIHTEVPPELEGGGVGSKLARAALDYAREQHLGVIPLCPFLSAFVRKHVEYQDLIAPAYRRHTLAGDD